MKKCEIFIILIALFTSCGQKYEPANHADNYKHGHEKPIPVIDSVLIPLDSANILIKNYQDYKIKILKEPKGYSSFILNANALRAYLNSDKDIASLNVYLAKRDTGAMTDTSLTLVYIGGIDSAGYDVEVPYVKPQDPKQQYFMDQVMPCPVCEKRIRSYNPQKKGS